MAEQQANSTAVSAAVDPSAIVARSATIGPGCVVGCGAVISEGTTLGHDVEVGANVVFVDHRDAPADAAAAHVRPGVRIGANATIYRGITLESGAWIRPGAVVTRSVPSGAIVEGNPAVIVGYVGTERSTTASRGRAGDGAAASPVAPTSVRGVTVHRFPIVQDLRGNLTVGEFARQIPFSPSRYFMVFGVPNREVRGEHAHRECHQFLLCVDGSCAVVADDGVSRVELGLDAPNVGVYLPPMTWGVQYKYTADAKLLVFASHHYDPQDYIRDYDEFLLLARRREASSSSRDV